MAMTTAAMTINNDTLRYPDQIWTNALCYPEFLAQVWLLYRLPDEEPEARSARSNSLFAEAAKSSRNDCAKPSECWPSPTPPPSGHATISPGIGCCAQVAGEHPTDLLAAADSALYKAKAAGRDGWYSRSLDPDSTRLEAAAAAWEGGSRN